jgi:hypothetical protein
LQSCRFQEIERCVKKTRMAAWGCTADDPRHSPCS